MSGAHADGPWRDPTGVLVTGATTPIGTRLCNALLALPGVKSVLAVGREHQDEAAIPRSPRLVYQQVDLTHPRQAHGLLFRVARDLGVEVVVHLSMHRSSAMRGKRVHALNVEALRSLLELAERHPSIRRVVLKSYAEVYRIDHALPNLVTEDSPLNLSPHAPQWIRDRVEADLTACAEMGMTRLEVAVLRCAEVLAPGTGSQIHDYLAGPLCLRPAGFDPMLNLLSLPDAVDALLRATRATGVQGVFNIPGRDTLPLRECLRKWGQRELPVPGPLIPPLYLLRRWLRGADFSYGVNWRRFLFASVLDGTRAREILGYVPSERLDWPA